MPISSYLSELCTKFREVVMVAEPTGEEPVVVGLPPVAESPKIEEGPSVEAGQTSAEGPSDV